MARVLRGNVVWENLNPAVDHEQAGRCPVVILSADVFNEHSGMAMALTDQPWCGRKIPWAVIRPAEGRVQRSVDPA